MILPYIIFHVFMKVTFRSFKRSSLSSRQCNSDLNAVTLYTTRERSINTAVRKRKASGKIWLDDISISGKTYSPNVKFNTATIERHMQTTWRCDRTQNLKDHTFLSFMKCILLLSICYHYAAMNVYTHISKGKLMSLGVYLCVNEKTEDRIRLGQRNYSYIRNYTSSIS